MIVVLEGQDEFRISERISEFRLTVTPPEMREINTAVIDGNLLTIGELFAAVSTVPFMADKRLVIVEGLLNKLGSPGKKGSSENSSTEWTDFPQLFAGTVSYTHLTLPTKA